METKEAIQTRRSVKHYDPDHKFSENEIRELMELTMLSPTSFNIQNWRFVIVRDQKMREEICAASWNQAQVKEAFLLVLLSADLHAHACEPERYWKNAPEQTQKMLVPMIGKFYEGNEQLQRDEAMRSVGIAGQTLMLAARSMGYESCPMIGFDPVKVGEIINLPEDHVIGMMVVVGKAKTPAHARGGQLSYDEVVITDKFE